MTDRTFQEIVKNNEMVVIKLWANWCQPCKKVGAVLETLAEEMAFSPVAFVAVDIDSNPVIARYFSIMSVPTVVIMKNGDIRSMQVGAKSIGLYRDLITGIMENE